jgi:hypothetical protein
MHLFPTTTILLPTLSSAVLASAHAYAPFTIKLGRYPEDHCNGTMIGGERAIVEALPIQIIDGIPAHQCHTFADSIPFQSVDYDWDRERRPGQSEDPHRYGYCELDFFVEAGCNDTDWVAIGFRHVSVRS